MSKWKVVLGAFFAVTLALVFWRVLSAFLAPPAPVVPLAEARAAVMSAAAGDLGATLCDQERGLAFFNAARAYAAATQRAGRAWPDYLSMDTPVDDAERGLIAANLSGRAPAINLSDGGFDYSKLRSTITPEILARSPREAREACPEIVNYWAAHGVHVLARLRYQRERARLQRVGADDAERALGVRTYHLNQRLYERVSKAERTLILRLRQIREAAR